LYRFNGAKTGKFCFGAILELYFMSEMLTGIKNSNFMGASIDLILVYVVLYGVFYKKVSQISKIWFLKILMPL
jgi:hypothetical protein